MRRVMLLPWLYETSLDKDVLQMKKRIAELEIIRFLCCLLVILHHMDVFSAYSMNGQYAVGFFFIVSGFFMQREAVKSISCCTPSPKEKTTFRFIASRLKHLYPYFIVSIAAGLMAWSAMRIVVGPLFWKLSHIWPELFLLQMFGNWPSDWWITGVSWFLGASLFGQMLFYPIAKVCVKKSIDGIFLISTIISWAIVVLYYPLSFQNPGNIWFSYLHQGLLLAWAGLSYGAALGEIYGRYPQAFKRLVHLRFFCYILAISTMFTAVPGLWIWGLLGAGVLLSVYYADNIKRCSSPWASFLGEWSVTLYLNHYYWALGLDMKFSFLAAPVKWVLYWGLSILTSLWVWWIVKRVLPYIYMQLRHIGVSIR